jgi:hypothetical protein
VRWTWGTLVACAVLLTACGTPGEATGLSAELESTASSTSPARITEDLAPLREWFAHSAGVPRAVALLSPT